MGITMRIKAVEISSLTGGAADSMLAHSCKRCRAWSIVMERKCKGTIFLSMEKMHRMHRSISVVTNNPSAARIFIHVKSCTDFKILHLNIQGNESNDGYRLASLCPECPRLQLLNFTFSISVVDTHRWPNSNLPLRLSDTLLGAWYIWLTKLVCVLYALVSKRTSHVQEVLRNLHRYSHQLTSASL